MKNERGGIISSLILIPLGVALMAGFFFLGYYVGKYQSRTVAQGEPAPPLPEMASVAGQKPEEFTFYKTLTDKAEKTVSIDLKPRPAGDDSRTGVKQVRIEPQNTGAREATPQEKKPVARTEKKPSSPEQTEKVTPRTQTQAKKETTSPTGSKLRYTLQIASYQERQAAEEDVKKMKKRGYAAFIASSELPGKGMWHRVRLGSFIEKAAAEKLQKTLLSKEGISPMIVIE